MAVRCQAIIAGTGQGVRQFMTVIFCIFLLRACRRYKLHLPHRLIFDTMYLKDTALVKHTLSEGVYVILALYVTHNY